MRRLRRVLEGMNGGIGLVCLVRKKLKSWCRHANKAIRAIFSDWQTTQ